MKPLIGSNFQNVLNPQKKSFPLKNPILSFRKRKSKSIKYKKISTLQKERSLSPNPLYQGLLNEEQSKHNQKNIGPWTRLSIHKSENVTAVEDSSNQNKIKIIENSTQKTLYPKKSNQKTTALDNYQKNANQIISPQKNFLLKISIRKAIIEQEDNPNVNFSKYKSSINLPKFQSFRSTKLLPPQKNQKQGQKGKSLQFGKVKIDKSSLKDDKFRKFQSIDMNSKDLVNKKVNGILESYNISLLKVNNIELLGGKSSRLTPIIHKTMKV